MGLDQVERGCGPIVIKTVAAIVFVVMISTVYSVMKIQKHWIEDGDINPTDQVLLAKHLLQPSLMDFNYLKFTYNASQFSEEEEEYDYIVVGGGTAGCPLATTLSANHSVLLLERGGAVNADTDAILLEQNILKNLLEADEKDSPVEAFTSEDGIPNARARILGGGSTINFGIYSRADNEFYTSSGIEWDMDVVEKAYEWVEETVVFRPDHLSKWESSVKKALLESGIGPYNGFTLDHKMGTKVSGSTFDNTGRKHGAAKLLNKAEPKNLKVVVHAMVERVIFSSSESLGLSAVGVIYRDSAGRSRQVRVRAKGEVILTAGAIGSPQLLLLSGIGPEPYLSSLNIPVVHHHPFVGQFMSDNPGNSICVESPFPHEEYAIGHVIGITDGSYIETSSNIPFYSPASFILFPDQSPPPNVSAMGIVEKVSRPLSTGSLRLAMESPTNCRENVEDSRNGEI